METRPQSPQPSGAPRWVAMFYDPASASWRPAAESPDRTPVLYAMGEMTQVKRARGEEVTVALWGPRGEDWHRFDATPAPAAAVEDPENSGESGDSGDSGDSADSGDSGDSGVSSPGAGAQAPTKLAERMEDRRHQVLMAGLSKAGLYDLTEDDATAVRALVDQVDETTLRRVAHWMAVAAGPSAAG